MLWVFKLVAKILINSFIIWGAMQYNAPLHDRVYAGIVIILLEIFLQYASSDIYLMLLKREYEDITNADWIDERIRKKMGSNVRILLVRERGVQALTFPKSLFNKKYTIIITRMARKLFDNDEMNGIIAHELGHINHGDFTKNVIMNTVFSTVLIVVPLFLPDSWLWFGVMVAVTTALEFLIIKVKRGMEFKADEFAFRLTGRSIISALSLLNFLGARTTPVDAHPELRERLSRLKEIEKRETLRHFQIASDKFSESEVLWYEPKGEDVV